MQREEGVRGHGCVCGGKREFGETGEGSETRQLGKDGECAEKSEVAETGADMVVGESAPRHRSCSRPRLPNLCDVSVAPKAVEALSCIIYVSKVFNQN